LRLKPIGFISLARTFIQLYKSMVCPHLKYANSVWCPYKMGDITEIEKVQKEQQN